MGLLFTDSSDSRSVHANIGSDPTVASWYAWVYPTALTAGIRIFCQLNPSGSTGFFLAQFAGTANFRSIIDYSSQDADARSSVAGLLTANKWQFLGAAFDGTNAPKLYYGDLATPVAEVASYDISRTPSGSRISDLGNDFVIANQNSNGNYTSGFPGNIAILHVLEGVTFTVSDFQSHQFRPRVTPNSNLFVHLGYNGTTSVVDWSGNQNNGTIVNASVTDHVPLPLLMSGIYTPYVVSGATPIDASFGVNLLTLTGGAISPTVLTTSNITINLSSLGVAGQTLQPTILTDSNVAVNLGVLGLTGGILSPSVSTGSNTTVTLGTLSGVLAQLAPQVTGGQTITAGLQTLATAGLSPSVVVNVVESVASQLSTSLAQLDPVVMVTANPTLPIGTMSAHVSLLHPSIITNTFSQTPVSAMLHIQIGIGN